MSKYCLNCNYPVQEKYCPQCGQATDVGRITWKNFAADFIHTLTHAEKSLGGTTWQMVKNPGKVLNEYIRGRRKTYMGPVPFFVIWVTASILIHRSILAVQGFHPVYLEGLTFEHGESIKAFITHGELFYLICFPLSSAIFYFFLANRFYSYIEAFVINMYCFGLSSMSWSFAYLIGGFAFGFNVLHWKFYLFQITMSQVLTLWVCISLFKQRGIKWLALRIVFYMAVNVVVVLQLLEYISDLWVQLENQIHF